jgi:hypothetical protein
MSSPCRTFALLGTSPFCVWRVPEKSMFTPVVLLDYMAVKEKCNFARYEVRRIAVYCSRKQWQLPTHRVLCT